MAVYERNPITGEETVVAGIQDIGNIEARLSAIEDDIPSDTSSSNKLVNEGSLGTASQKDYTPNVQPDNHNLVESNAVYNAIASAVSSLYTARGNITCAELVPSLLVATNKGYVYNVTDSGTTTEYFINGAGKTINANDAVGIVQTGENEYKFNLMSGLVNLSAYQTKTLATPIIVDEATKTTVENTLSALATLGNNNKTAISSVEEVIPSDASTSNKLVTKNQITITFEVNRISFGYTKDQEVPIATFIADMVSKYGEGYYNLSFSYSDANAFYLICDNDIKLYCNGNRLEGYFRNATYSRNSITLYNSLAGSLGTYLITYVKYTSENINTTTYKLVTESYALIRKYLKAEYDQTNKTFTFNLNELGSADSIPLYDVRIEVVGGNNMHSVYQVSLGKYINWRINTNPILTQSDIGNVTFVISGNTLTCTYTGVAYSCFMTYINL